MDEITKQLKEARDRHQKILKGVQVAQARLFRLRLIASMYGDVPEYVRIKKLNNKIDGLAEEYTKVFLKHDFQYAFHMKRKGNDEKSR